MIDVFVTTSGRRKELLDDVAAWWRAAVGAEHLNIVVAGATLKGFDADRRRIAERESTTDIYVLTDDDILPTATPSEVAVFNLAALMEHRELAQVSAWLDNEPLRKAPDVGPDLGPIMTSLESGGLRVRRKGVWTEIPETPAPYPHFDTWDGAVAREKGYVVGYARNWHALHIGKFQSEQWTEGGEALEHAKAAYGDAPRGNDAHRA